tara:strand:- start:2824 stop:3435 length:612 start_codon:yes stop_codon:yes gene_type:complete
MNDEEEVVSPHEEVAEVVTEMQEDHGVESGQAEQAPREEHVPLSKFIRERKKRQDLEQKYQELSKQQSQKEDTSMYETATKQDLGHTQSEIIRVVEERQWIKSNPEKYERLEANLSDFLEQRPHLAEAIKHSPNRWEEAYTLMDALTPKQQPQQRFANNQAKKAAPNAPTSVPKSAGISQVEDVMDMTDAEYRAYRMSKSKKR